MLLEKPQPSFVQGSSGEFSGFKLVEFKVGKEENGKYEMAKQRTHSWLGLRGEKYNSHCGFKLKEFRGKEMNGKQHFVRRENTAPVLLQSRAPSVCGMG